MITLKNSQATSTDKPRSLPHVPVLLKEVISGLNIKPDGIYVDLTLGRAGHAKAILEHLPNGLLIGIDRDNEAIKEAKNILSKSKNRYLIRYANFKDIGTILDELNVRKIDGAVMDLGVSSPQFDDPERGFSYRYDARLDMRMDQKQKLTAYDVVNTYSEDELNRIFKEYGEEKYARSIARSIVKVREKNPIVTTFQLVELIKNAKPNRELKKIGHPAKQVFQALRIEVNDELSALKDAIDVMTKRLKPSGRIAIITFHSGEDRIVKSYYKSLSTVVGSRNGPPIDPKNVEKPTFALVTKKPILPTDEEIERNPRAKSAKLRIIERL